MNKESALEMLKGLHGAIKDSTTWNDFSVEMINETIEVDNDKAYKNHPFKTFERGPKTVITIICDNKSEMDL